jgi:hypothetical protein
MKSLPIQEKRMTFTAISPSIFVIFLYHRGLDTYAAVETIQHLSLFFSFDIIMNAL